MKRNKLTLALITGTLLASIGIGAHAGEVSRTDNGRGVNQWTEYSNFKSAKTRAQIREELRQAHDQNAHWPKEYQDPAQTTVTNGHSHAQNRGAHSSVTGTGLRKPGDIYYGS